MPTNHTWLITMGFPGGRDGKEYACNAGDLGLITGSGRSHEEGNGYHSNILAQKIPWTEEPDRSPQSGKEMGMTEQLTLNPQQLVSLQFSSVAQSCLFAAPQLAANQASLCIANSQSLFKLMSIKSVMPSNHLILCHPLLLLPSIFPSIRVFSDESVLHIRWPKYWSFSFSISPSNEYSGLISFRMGWLDLLAIQGTLKSLLQYQSSKASILRHSVFFIVQLSHTHMTTGKNCSFDQTDICWQGNVSAF